MRHCNTLKRILEYYDTRVTLGGETFAALRQAEEDIDSAAEQGNVETALEIINQCSEVWVNYRRAISSDSLFSGSLFSGDIRNKHDEIEGLHVSLVQRIGPLNKKLEEQKTEQDRREEEARISQEADEKLSRIRELYLRINKAAGQDDFDDEALESDAAEVAFYKDWQPRYELLSEENAEKIDKVRNASKAVWQKATFLVSCQCLEDVIVTDPHNNVLERYDRLYLMLLDIEKSKNNDCSDINAVSRLLERYGLFMPSFAVSTRATFPVSARMITGSYVDDISEVNRGYKVNRGYNMNISMCNYFRLINNDTVRLNTGNAPEYHEVKIQRVPGEVGGERIYLSLERFGSFLRAIYGTPLKKKFSAYGRIASEGILTFSANQDRSEIYARSEPVSELKANCFFGATTDEQVFNEAVRSRLQEIDEMYGVKFD